jgi:biopolymer transport protein ExbD
MNRMLEVCLIALTLTAGPTSVAAAQSGDPTVPQLRPGISVELAPTSHARPMPDADRNDALVLAVTERGIVYLGTNPVAARALAQEINDRLSTRPQKLFIKADARTPYAKVLDVFKAAKTSGVDAPILLTAQPDSENRSTIAPPEGLEVLVGPASLPGTVTTVVELLNSGQQQPLLRVNGDEIPWSDLESTLTRHFQKGDEKVILLKADLRLPFAEVVHGIDVARSTGAKVVLIPPQL